MGLIDTLTGGSSGGDKSKSGAIDYGKNKSDGSHDHRYNTGPDRTPSQKKADNGKHNS